MAMMPRRTLLVLTAGVLALHWLALAGVPLQSHTPLGTPVPVFSTRTLAAPPPQPLPPPAPTAPVAALSPVPAPAPKPPPPRRPPARKKPAAAAPAVAEPTSTAATDSAGLASRWDAMGAPMEEVAAQTPAPAPTPDALATPSATEAAPPPAADATAQAEAARAAPENPAAAAPPASAIDIQPPGAVARSGASAAPAVQIPAPQRLQFDVSGEVKKFHYSARAELLWQHDGQQYQARQEISILFLGSRTQSSTGALSEGGLRPQRFADRSRSEQAAHFDYAQGQVTFSANTPTAPMVTGTQDRLSVFIQLGALLAAAPERYPPGTRISLATVSARAADVWAFTVEDEETLDLPAGSISARKLQRLPRRDHDYDQKAELWLAPSLGYLPVRIRITQANGDFADLRLRSHAPP